VTARARTSPRRGTHAETSAPPPPARPARHFCTRTRSSVAVQRFRHKLLRRDDEEEFARRLLHSLSVERVDRRGLGAVLALALGDYQAHAAARDELGKAVADHAVAVEVHLAERPGVDEAVAVVGEQARDAALDLRRLVDLLEIGTEFDSLRKLLINRSASIFANDLRSANAINDGYIAPPRGLALCRPKSSARTSPNCRPLQIRLG